MMVVLWVAVGFWALGEVGLQLTQVLRSQRTRRTEWGSYGGIVLSAAVAVVLARLIRNLVPALDFRSHSTEWLVAIAALIVLGAGFRFWAIVTLGRYFRAVVHIQEGHRVVRSGPYKLLRHPSYTGLLVALLGVAFLFGNVLSAIVFELIVIAGVLYRIRIEEKVLLDGLGEPYGDYMRATKRLIPGVW